MRPGKLVVGSTYYVQGSLSCGKDGLLLLACSSSPYAQIIPIVYIHRLLVDKGTRREHAIHAFLCKGKLLKLRRGQVRAGVRARESR
jgi:hypothetical protein